MRAARASPVWLLAALTARLLLAQAPLPTSWTGPWQYGAPPEGWVFQGLGGPDYNPDLDGLNDGAAKLDGTGDFVSVHYDRPAGSVSYWIKGLTFSGGVFRVEQSVDGLDWTPLQVYTLLPTNAVIQTHFPSLAARHVRFFYETKGTGNVGLDGIFIQAVLEPIIADILATDDAVSVALQDSTAGRAYVLENTAAITNVPVEWALSDSQSSTGGALVLRDLTPTNLVRFYRVRDTTP